MYESDQVWGTLHWGILQLLRHYDGVITTSDFRYCWMMASCRQVCVHLVIIIIMVIGAKESRTGLVKVCESL